MANFKFDGQKLKNGATTVATVRGDAICKGTGSTKVCNIRGDTIRDGSGASVSFNIKGDDIRQGGGSTKIATMKDVDKDIDGPGRLVKAALWLYFVR